MGPPSLERASVGSASTSAGASAGASSAADESGADSSAEGVVVVSSTGGTDPACALASLACSLLSIRDTA